MSQQKYLYVVFSATDYRLGRCIRFITGEPYNHVSIATEQDLSDLCAFARRYYHTPLYGGFVTEQPCRYHHKGRTARIALYRLPVTQQQYELLQQRLAKMNARADRYLYNHLSALAAPFHRKITIRDAYTCAEFTVSILQQLGFGFSTRKFYTIGDIRQKLAPYHIYAGEFPLPNQQGSRFFDTSAVPHPVLASTRDILRLLWRMARA